MSDCNRSQRARQVAGLSIGQAAKLLKIEPNELIEIEIADTLSNDDRRKLAALYRVCEEWLTGEVALRDYSAVDSIKGSELLSFHDRDVIAEFAAAIRGIKPKTLEDIAKEKG